MSLTDKLWLHHVTARVKRAPHSIIGHPSVLLVRHGVARGAPGARAPAPGRAHLRRPLAVPTELAAGLSLRAVALGADHEHKSAALDAARLVAALRRTHALLRAPGAAAGHGLAAGHGRHLHVPVRAAGGPGGHCAGQHGAGHSAVRGLLPGRGRGLPRLRSVRRPLRPPPGAAQCAELLARGQRAHGGGLELRVLRDAAAAGRDGHRGPIGAAVDARARVHANEDEGEDHGAHGVHGGLGSAGVGYGQLACSALGQGGLGWRTAYGVLSAIALLFAAVLYLALEESPKYLASVGRTQEALYVLEKIETAHGIHRQARVTVPTSLYEPPSQRPHVSYERYLESSSDSDSDLDLDLDLRCSGQEEEIQRDMRARAASRSNRYSYAGPGAAKARSQSQRASARRLPSRHQRQFEVCTPSSGDLGTPSDTLAPTADTSFLRSLARRVVALFSGSLARRTALIWFFWFAECTCLSAAIVTTLMMAGTFVKVNALGTGFEVGDQLFWAAMTFPGLLLAATMVETVGRRGTLAVFVFGAGAVMVISAWLLEEDGEWLGLLLSLGALVLTTGGTIGSMIPFTGEQFPLLTRALGISCAAGWGHLGMFAGAYLVLRRVMGDEAWTWHDERLMLAVCGAVSIILIPLILFMGPETRGRDIDASWFEDNKALHALAGGVLSAAPGGRPDQPASRCRGVGKASIGRGSKKLSKASESSDGDDHELPESPFGRGSMNGRTLAAPVIYSPNSAALAAAHSPGEYESSCSSSSSSGFWQTHSVRHLSHKMKRAAQAIAHTSDEKHAVYLPSEGKLRARSTSGAKQTRNVDDRCDTVIDDLDQLETIVTEHEYRQHRLSVDDPKESQPRRQSLLELLEPVLLEWRRSISSSLSGSTRDLSGSSKASKAEHSASTSTDMQSAITASDVRSSATGRYTIDLDMFDTFTYISTPVLGGDNYEHREPSNLSSVSSGDTKQTSS